MPMHTVVDDIGDGFTVVADFVYDSSWLHGGERPRLVKLRIEAPLALDEREVGSVELRAVKMVKLHQTAQQEITALLR